MITELEVVGVVKGRGSRLNDHSIMEELKCITTSSPTLQPRDPDPRAKDAGLKIRYNITYIVAGLVIQDGKVLMMQEAKQSCRGTWYLPAGRMEENETIVEATKREVLEETGLEFEPEALVYVEAHHLWRWIRFTLVGHVSGGCLKTSDQADKESLQANWFEADTSILPKKLHLRAYDILPLIDAGKAWQRSKLLTSLPVDVGHVSASVRLVVAHCTSSSDEGQVSVLMEGSTVSSTRLPVYVIDKAFSDPIRGAVKDCGFKGNFNVCGVLGVEHSGKMADGYCLTVVIQALTQDPLHKESKYQWTSVTDTHIAQTLKKAIYGEFGCVTLDV